MLKKYFLSLIVIYLLSLIVINDTVRGKEVFPDTTKHWAKDAIKFLHDKSIVKGLPNGKFGVDNKITRGDAAIMIARAKGLSPKNTSGKNLFKDVSPSSYYYKEVIAATEAGYLNGYPDQTFKPQGQLTREEMAKILVNTYGMENKGGAVFKDVKVKSWSFSSIQTLVSNKIANGFPDHTFQPKKSITRSEFAMLLARTMDSSFRDPNFLPDTGFRSQEEEIKYVLENYSPSSYYILQQVSIKENKNIETLISKWKNAFGFFDRINVAVHEETHGFQNLTDSIYDFGNNRWIFKHTHSINNNKYVVSYNDHLIFPSSKINTQVPEKLRTYRWDTYMSYEANTSSNIRGVYGILKEFEAYYQGDKAAYDSYEYLLTLPYSSANWLNYYGALDGSAFYEFKFFTLSYLLYAKQYEPKIYSSIMKNQSFKTAFKYVYNNYKNYVEVLLPAREKEIVRDLQKRAISAKVENGFLYIEGSGRGTGINVSAIKQEMNQLKYTTILNELLR